MGVRASVDGIMAIPSLHKDQRKNVNENSTNTNTAADPFFIGPETRQSFWPCPSSRHELHLLFAHGSCTNLSRSMFHEHFLPDYASCPMPRTKTDRN